MASVDIIQLFIDKINQLQDKKKIISLNQSQKISSLGLDSLLIMEVLGDIQDELDIDLSAEELSQIQTVSDLEQLILKALKN